jgi:hypothetical protein
MAVNQTRGTPGVILMGFTVAMLAIALSAWRQSVAGTADATVPLTALYDTTYYSKFSDNDFASPVLDFPDAPHPLFRRTVNPVHRDDAKMLRTGRERSGQFFVYTEARPKLDDEGRPIRRWFLKAADNRYVEFGERKVPSSTTAPRK